jgi:competence protein ComEA
VGIFLLWSKPYLGFKQEDMGWKQFVKDYLNFTRRERIAVIVITGVILVVLMAPSVLSKTKSYTPAKADTAWVNTVNRLEIKQPDSTYRDNQTKDDNGYAYQYDRSKNNYSNDPQTKGELFYFDPNKISATEWKRLGLRDKTIQTIQNYLNKGGKFRKPEDLQRVYGLHKDEFERLEPYVRIESDFENRNSEPFTATTNEKPEIKNYTSRYSVIDVNAADTTAFISLPGIGSKLAARIVNFRDKLGGFYSVDQVKETFGLPDSTYQKIKQYLKLDNPSVKKININTATVDELKAHPYIKYSLANPIVAYRNEHGLFSKVEDLKKVMAVTEEIYTRIERYLKTE